MKDTRPKIIDPTKYRYPPMAIVSIIHRVSGVVIFLLIPLVLWMLGKSLDSPARFDDLRGDFSNPVLRFFTWAVLSAMLYHLVAGIRHIIMDLGYGESLKTGRITAKITMVISAILILLAGVWLW